MADDQRSPALNDMPTFAEAVTARDERGGVVPGESASGHAKCWVAHAIHEALIVVDAP